MSGSVMLTFSRAKSPIIACRVRRYIRATMADARWRASSSGVRMDVVPIRAKAASGVNFLAICQLQREPPQLFTVISRGWHGSCPDGPADHLQIAGALGGKDRQGVAIV